MTQQLTTSVVEALLRIALADHVPPRDGCSELWPSVECDNTVHAVSEPADTDNDAEPLVWTSPVQLQPSEHSTWSEPAEPRTSPAHDWSRPGVSDDADAAVPSPAVDAVTTAVAALAATPASGRPVDVAALLRASEQLQGFTLRAVAEMDATGTFLSAGAVTAATWLRDTEVISDLGAKAKVRLATTLRDELPRVEALLCDGDTTLDHARAVVAGTRGLDPRIIADSQEAICALLATADPRTVRTELRERAEAISPELGHDAERRAHARRGFTADTVPNGVALGGALGVEDGQVFLLGLDLAVQSDRTDGDTRSLRQRRADALVQWARQAATEHGEPAGSVADDLRTTRTHLLLTCTAEQLQAARAWLAGVGTPPPAGPVRPGSAEDVTGPGWPWGVPTDPANTCGPGGRMSAGGSVGPGALVSSAALRRLVCDAAVSLAVLPDADTDTGDSPLGLRPDAFARRPAPLYVGRAARIVTASQWKALVLRDGHCVVRGCRRRPANCQAHHVRHWLDGGGTDLDNLVLLCHQHHHEHHDRGRDLQHRDGRWLTHTGWGAHAPPRTTSGSVAGGHPRGSGRAAGAPALSAADGGLDRVFRW